ncbi:MAG: cytochrome c1 [Betaproteobacteria bacterium]|nr:cytochrome c1 [Betaproteobacteria bacterium]
MKKLLVLLCFAPALALAAGGSWPLESAPLKPTDVTSLQSGASAFVNYCLNCHGVAHVRYTALKGIGLTDMQIRDNLLFTQPKVTNMMTVAMRPEDAKQWFGVPPPDLSVITRVRGADWLYGYLRAFYRDSNTMTGWNNAVFPNVAMPHALWELQGERAAIFAMEKDGHGGEHRVLKTLEPAKGGALTPLQYDQLAGDLVNFLVWASEPGAVERKRVGYYVLMVLGALVLLTYLLKAAFWKDVH